MKPIRKRSVKVRKSQTKDFAKRMNSTKDVIPRSTKGIQEVSWRDEYKKFTPRSNRSRKSSRTRSHSSQSRKFELTTVWNDEDEIMVNEILNQCKKLEENRLQSKLEYFYSPYDLSPEVAPIKPMRFDQDDTQIDMGEESFKEKAKENWRKLSQTILTKNTADFRTLVKSVNQYAYPKLKKFAMKIMSPKFQSIMAMLKNFPNDRDLDEKMKYAKEGIVQLEQIIRESSCHFSDNFDLDDNYELDEDSLISSLLKIKRSKMESIVEKIGKFYGKSQKTFAKKAVKRFTKAGIDQFKLQKITKKVAKSTKNVSNYNISVTTPRIVSFALGQEKEKRLNGGHHKNSIASIEDLSYSC